MMVGEAEFAFTFARALPRRANPYTQEEVLAAVESLHPAIEVPDSRYNDFVKVGAPQLIADSACADWFVLGPATSAEWRSRDLVAHTVVVFVNGAKVSTGSGANVLGDPRIALTWWRTNCAPTPTRQVGQFVLRSPAACRCQNHRRRVSRASLVGSVGVRIG